MPSFKCLSLFSGAGGLDIGIERAGIEVVAACEIDDAANRTLVANKNHRHADGFPYLKGARIVRADLSQGHDNLDE
jgi:site-specific DNA-cytosine methylase